MLNILALETATDACSVAIMCGPAVFEVHELAPRQHTDLLFTMIERVLAEAGIARSALDVVAFGRGPGAFTGVRIAASVAQGIALASDLPLAPVSTLTALAAGGARLYGGRQIIAALDARRDEIYLTALRFDAVGGLAQSVIADCVLAPQGLSIASPQQWLAVGNGWPIYHSRFAPTVAAIPRAPLLHPHAHDVAQLAAALHGNGGCVAVAAAWPVYLRGAVDAEPPV